MSSEKKVRDELLDRLRYELIGPENQQEEIKVKPLQKYIAGILWPMKSGIATEEDEQDDTMGRGTSDENVEIIAPLAKAMNPSAVGISFLVDKGNPNLLVDVSLGMYEEISENHWKRNAYGLHNFEIDLTGKMGVKCTEPIKQLDSREEYKEEEGEGNREEDIKLEWLVRKYNNFYAVSMFIVNRYKQKTDDYSVDHKCVFQPQLSVRSKHDRSIMPRNAFSNNDKGFQDEDTRSNELLYRDDAVYGVGHNIAVNWKNPDAILKRTGTLETEIIPAYEVPMVIPPDRDFGGTLDMRSIADMTSPQQVNNALAPLLEAYGKWIKDRKSEISSIQGDKKETAIEHIKKCQSSLDRMREGLEKLDDELAFQSFIFANNVMAKQRAHTVYAEEGIDPEEVSAKWRPFQIAFVLQNIKGIVDPESDDRQIADLLWFPTGGGKTEAYLGLAAFTLGFRRLQKLDNYRTDVGVAVIMRYTLRLLTVQQFQRATSMICACEEMRSQAPEKWGETPFRIGLWVGQNSAPNEYDDAKEAINTRMDAIKQGQKNFDTGTSKGTPVQLVSCPWCGSKLIDENRPKLFLKTYKNKDKRRRVLIYCPNNACSFHRHNSDEGLPVLVTDEEIYRLLPDLVIGTVDKFARMPWRPEIQNLFGKVKGEILGWGFISNGHSKIELNHAKNIAGTTDLTSAKTVHPPNLIIQDELHLISGPLGTMVGLYETAVDYLSSVKKNNKIIGPKVVASTATIRNADKQIEGLYNRRTQIFPSPGLTHKDSFFAQQNDKMPGRLYVGLFAPGRSMKTVLLRAYANMLSSVTKMKEKSRPEDLDPYYTLVGYFNSLRELGGAVRLIEDDVPARMNTIERQFDEKNKYQFSKRMLDRDVPELTSRIDSSDIPKLLSRLQKTHHKKADSQIEPIDVLLASNMISVGVDVSRLGLMVVNGQPKTTAEYIQSTSRVGRQSPGLVITSYNWARPRDISHYEEFYAYHSTLYRYVEPISVTPFASRARDRGLAAVLVSMLRLGNSDLTENRSAGWIEQINPASKNIMKLFIERARQMNLPTEDIGEHLEGLINDWEIDAGRSKLNYYKPNPKSESNLLYQLGGKEDEGTFKIPNSMRDVEQTTGLYLG